MTQTAAEVSATRVSTADQPETGGRWRRKKTITRAKKRSILVRWPSGSAVQVGGKPSRRCCRFGIPRDDRRGVQHGVDPRDQLEPPGGGIQAHHPRAPPEPAHGQLEPRAGKGGIVDIGGREEEEQRQAGAATEPRVPPVA
jgi:hypothetical protein